MCMLIMFNMAIWKKCGFHPAGNAFRIWEPEKNWRHGRHNGFLVLPQTGRWSRKASTWNVFLVLKDKEAGTRHGNTLKRGNLYANSSRSCIPPKNWFRHHWVQYLQMIYSEKGDEKEPQLGMTPKLATGQLLESIFDRLHAATGISLSSTMSVWLVFSACFNML